MKKNSNKFLREVVRKCHPHRSLKAADIASIKNYMKSKLEFYSIYTPIQRELHKQGYSFSKLPFKQQLKIWNEIWMQSSHFEVMNQALYFIDDQELTDLALAWPVLKGMSVRIENWGHSDSLSSIYSRLLEAHPKKVFPVLKRWNKSKNPWLRRQSIVSLLYYRRLRKNLQPFNEMLALVDALLKDDHYYVQKGVGWTLRELYQVDAAKTLAYIEANITHLHPAAYTAATEKMSLAQKQKIKKLRAQRKRSF